MKNFIFPRRISNKTTSLLGGETVSQKSRIGLLSKLMEPDCDVWYTYEYHGTHNYPPPP